jgi:hypothetical protein
MFCAVKTMLIPTTAQQLDTKIYNHTTCILHAAVFFVHLLEVFKKKWVGGANYVIDVQL